MATTTNNYNLRPFKLRPRFVERIWGRTDLKPWYAETGVQGKVGEAWLTGPDCVIVSGQEEGRTLASLAQQCTGTLDGNSGGGEFPLLVKMLFPQEKLSVQVHPDDAQARASGLARGKTECWYVLEAEPGAKVACGLKAGLTTEQFAAAVAAGTAEDLLEWLQVAVGEMIYVDAGTVHAIGGGMVLLEVQQTSDVTYRLYDYGRDRELHLEQGLAVVRTRTEAGKVESFDAREYERLIQTKYFQVDRFELPAGLTIEMAMDGVGCVVGLKGNAAANEVRFGVGEAVVVPPGSVSMSSVDGAIFVRCWEPSRTS